MSVTGPGADETVARLAWFFRHHRVWAEAGRLLRPEASSDVYFRHLPGARYHLRRVRGYSELAEGGSPDPDFALRFTRQAVASITAVEGGIGDFAIELFGRAVDPDPDRRVDIRIVSAFPKLLRRGYVRLLLAGGPRLLAFGMQHGVPDLASLRRLVRELGRQGPAGWEAPPPCGGPTDPPA